MAAAHVLDLELDFMLVLNGCKSSTLLIEGCVCVPTLLPREQV